MGDTSLVRSSPNFYDVIVLVELGAVKVELLPVLVCTDKLEVRIDGWKRIGLSPTCQRSRNCDEK